MDTFLQDVRYAFRTLSRSPMFALIAVACLAIGIGVNDPAYAAKFLREGDFDCMLLAGRYSLLEQPALQEVLPLVKPLQQCTRGSGFVCGSSRYVRYVLGEACENVV